MDMKHFGKRRASVLVCILILTLMAGFFSPVTSAEVGAKAKTIKLSKKTVTLKTKKKYTLKVKNLPKKAKTTWAITKGKKYISLSAKKRTSVKIKAKKKGTAKVTAKIKLPKKKKIKKLVCTVKVKLPSDEKWEEYTPTPRPTLPPHIEPEGTAEFTITDDGVLTGANLKNVYEAVIPDGVKEIADNAFAFCHTLEKLTIPEGVEKIGARAFNECTRLQDVTFPSTVKVLGKEAFFECSSLENVHLNDGLISIGAGSFFQCVCLKSIVIPSSVTEVGDYCFAYDDHLESAQIDAALTEIPREMFDSCEKLKSVSIPSTVKKIGSRAFYDVIELKGLALPKGMEEVGFAAFESCSIGDQQIDVRKIDEKAFAGTNMTQIDLSDRVEEIGKEAFSCCGDTEKGVPVKIPASVTGIEYESVGDMGVNEFQVDKNNKVVKSVDGVLFSADGKKLIAFPKYRTIKTYKIPEGVEEIGNNAFEACKITKSITIPASVKKIGKRAFAYTTVPKLVLPDGITSIGSEALSNMKVKELVIPDSVTEIGDGAFSSNELLEKITLSSGLKKIPFHAFDSCVKLSSVTIPASVESIDPDAFGACDALKDYDGLTFAEGANFSSKDGSLYDKSGTKYLAYPRMNSEDYSDLETVVIPDGVKEIGAYAFTMDVYSVQVPDSVEEIGKYALGFKRLEERKEKMGVSDTLKDFHIISTGKAALDYAEEYDIDIVSEEDPEYFYKHEVRLQSQGEDPNENVKKVTLKAGETTVIDVKGVITKKYFFTSDEKIATVDNKGVITAVANGTTSIIEATGSMYFCLEVTVTDGEDPVYDESMTVFRDEDEEAVLAWEELYLRYNPLLWFSQIDYPATCTYSGNSYNAVTAPFFGKDSSNYKVFITDFYGKGGGEYFNTISENLKQELSEPKLNADILLYSGKNAQYGIDYITVDGKATLESLMASIGSTPTYPNVISTSLYRSVCNGFAGGRMGALLEIEGCADKVDGMLIRKFSKYPLEMEFLLNQGIKFKIVDAGVRRFFNVKGNGDEMTEDPSARPYIRMEIV